MKIIRLIEHNGVIFNIGDEIEVEFDNGNKTRGKIKEFGTYGFIESGLEDGIEFGKYCVPFSEIASMKKIERKSDEIINFAVAVIAKVYECSKKEYSPICEDDKEVDFLVRFSDVENCINKCLKEYSLNKMKGV